MFSLAVPFYILISSAAVTFLLKAIRGKLESSAIRRRYGCEEPSRLSQSKFLFGLDFVFDFMKKARAHQALEHLRHMHESLGYTFSAYVLGDTFFHTVRFTHGSLSIYTCEPKLTGLE